MVNISPADIRKEGTGFDLPIAIGILVSNGIIEEEKVKDTLVLGELSLMEQSILSMECFL